MGVEATRTFLHDIGPRWVHDTRRFHCLLVDDLDNSARAWVNQHGAFVHVGIAIVWCVILGGNFVVRHAAFR